MKLLLLLLPLTLLVSCSKNSSPLILSNEAEEIQSIVKSGGVDIKVFRTSKDDESWHLTLTAKPVTYDRKFDVRWGTDGFNGWGERDDVILPANQSTITQQSIYSLTDYGVPVTFIEFREEKENEYDPHPEKHWEYKGKYKSFIVFLDKQLKKQK
jgi:hypothetical protein